MRCWSASGSLELFQKLGGDNTGARIDGELHRRDLLVNLLHEENDKVDQLVLPHFVHLRVCDQEAKVIVLEQPQTRPDEDNKQVEEIENDVAGGM